MSDICPSLEYDRPGKPESSNQQFLSAICSPEMAVW